MSGDRRPLQGSGPSARKHSESIFSRNGLKIYFHIKHRIRVGERDRAASPSALARKTLFGERRGRIRLGTLAAQDHFTSFMRDSRIRKGEIVNFNWRATAKSRKTLLKLAKVPAEPRFDGYLVLVSRQ